GSGAGNRASRAGNRYDTPTRNRGIIGKRPAGRNADAVLPRRLRARPPCARAPFAGSSAPEVVKCLVATAAGEQCLALEVRLSACRPTAGDHLPHPYYLFAQVRHESPGGVGRGRVLGANDIAIKVEVAGIGIAVLAHQPLTHRV